MATGLAIASPYRRGGLVGPELLSNGEFASDTVWTKGVGWTITAGTAVVTTPGATSLISQPANFVVGALYQMTIVVSSMTAAALIVRGYNGASSVVQFGATITAPGTYVRYAVADLAADTFAILGSAAAIASIDSVSLRRVY